MNMPAVSFPCPSLKPSELEIVHSILARLVPDLEVWAFGSRVRGTAREFSDLDIVLITASVLPLAVKADLVAAFSQSDLPFKVDIVDWSVTDAGFRKIIEQQKVVLQAGATASL
ncbi:MAG: nucleotidyltransferase domain-containing protein [Geopsychrobacter sp.]|nr:nucleotidyltransferase domain-containing protein [Geopsychrobacter sp.]